VERHQGELLPRRRHFLLSAAPAIPLGVLIGAFKVGEGRCSPSPSSSAHPCRR
jgi:hypothetical protein